MADTADKERRIVIKQGRLMTAQNEFEKQQTTFYNVAKQLSNNKDGLSPALMIYLTRW